MSIIVTGVDFSKILGEQTKILGEQKEVNSDKCMGVSQLLGALALAAPKSTPMIIVGLPLRTKHKAFIFNLLAHRNIV